MFSQLVCQFLPPCLYQPTADPQVDESFQESQENADAEIVPEIWVLFQMFQETFYFTGGEGDRSPLGIRLGVRASHRPGLHYFRKKI